MNTYVLVRKADHVVMGLMTTSTKAQAEAAAARRWTLTGQKFQAIAWDKATAEQQQAATQARIVAEAAEAQTRAASGHRTRMAIVTDACFDNIHADCTGKLGEGYGNADCGCDCHSGRTS